MDNAHVYLICICVSMHGEISVSYKTRVFRAGGPHYEQSRKRSQNLNVNNTQPAHNIKQGNYSRSLGKLLGGLVGWSIGCFVACLVGCLVCHLVGCVWSVVCLLAWLVCCLASWLVGSLVGRFRSVDWCRLVDCLIYGAIGRSVG